MNLLLPVAVLLGVGRGTFTFIQAHSPCDECVQRRRGAVESMANTSTPPLLVDPDAIVFKLVVKPRPCKDKPISPIRLLRTAILPVNKGWPLLISSNDPGCLSPPEGRFCFRHYR